MAKFNQFGRIIKLLLVVAACAVDVAMGDFVSSCRSNINHFNVEIQMFTR
jgi:hypothetical protein